MRWIYITLIFAVSSLYAIEGQQQEQVLHAFITWFGQFHPILLHFPIALILMVGVSEILFTVTKNPAYNFSTTFLLISAAFLAFPTVLAGWAYSQGADYQGHQDLLFDFHKFFGVTTLFLSFATVWVRLYTQKRWLYLSCLVLLIASVCSAAFFGGELTFGTMHWFPAL